MSESEPGRKPEPVDEADESAKLYVADPDDYAKTRKMKAINDTKAHVRKLRNDRPNQATHDEWDGINSRIAEAVASYGHELYPLLLEAEENGIIEEEDYILNDKFDVRFLIASDGDVEDEDGGSRKAKMIEVMGIYRRLQQLERKLGLGLELKEQTDDEWEIQT